MYIYIYNQVAIGSVLHQDGGVLVNNPTGLAVHEARMLWPDEKLQCVISVGNGRTVTELEATDVRLLLSILFRDIKIKNKILRYLKILK